MTSPNAIREPMRSLELRWKYTDSSVVAFWNQSIRKHWPLRLQNRRIPYTRELRFPVIYKGRQLSCQYRPNFICFGSVIVELKALGQLSRIEESQLINYLKVTGYQVGL